ncbi:hypothetical protein BGW38_006786 [Lunasporangiospora selenospora]|uniref:C2H2-type domain-containing protein n=1 Tax=Lunasporangiospora selenospora TaxID=979761 RepID=A0A9P6FZB6_9FUNG|nr:hypothetical protein BGW38_006786 [Lunasporangiospora selenospora]
MTATLCHNSPRSGTLGSIRYHAYPSPSPSPTSRSYVTVDSFCSLDQPYRPSTTTLCSQTSSTLSFKTNTHLPASPLDALVMALEATAGEMEGVIDQSPPSSPLATSACSTLSDQSDLEAVELRVSSDPENSNNEVDIANTSASVLLSNPSDSKSHSETVAKPKCHTVASLLQHIPSLALSESTAAVVLALASLPPIALPPIMGPIESESCSSHWPTAGGQSSSVVNMPAEPRSNPEYGHRRMSSSSSSSSCSGDSSSCSTSTKAYACSAANCGKRFCQASSLRIHER